MKPQKTISLLFLVMLTCSLVNCSRVEIKDDLRLSSTFNSQGIKIVIFPTNELHEDFADCLKMELEVEVENLEFIDRQIFLDRLYPWFEPRFRPKFSNQLISLMGRRLVRERINDLGIELLILVEGRTSWDHHNYVLGSQGGAAGYWQSDKKTQVSATGIRSSFNKFEIIRS